MKRQLMYTGIVLAGIAAILQAGKLLDMVKKNQADLATKREQLVKKRAELVSVYELFNKELLEGISRVISGPSPDPSVPPLNTLLSDLAVAKNAVANAPKDPVFGISSTVYAGIDDISRAITTIEDVLNGTKELLENIKSRFEPLVNDLSPSTDPQGVYAGFDAAVVDMDKTLVELSRFEVFVTKLGL